MRPLLISSQAPVSTLAVFVGVISAFGVISVIIGPVLLILVLARFGQEQVPEEHPHHIILARRRRAAERI